MKETQWSDEYGYISDGKVYLRGYFDFPDRHIGEVKVSPEASVKYFKDRFETARQKVDELFTLVETAQNKGSYLMKLIHLRQYLAEFDGLGDYIALFGRLDVLEEELRQNITQNRARNLEIKQALLQEAEALKTSTDWKSTTEVFKELKSKWIRTGAVDKEYQDQVEARFNAVIDGFFDRRKAFFEHKNRIINQRLEQLNQLNQRAQVLKESENWDATASEMKKMQEEWKNVGKIPRGLTIEVRNSFKQAYDYFFTRFRQAKNIPDRPYVKRVDPKVLAQQKFCREAEELLQSADLVQAADRAKQLLMEWKNLKLPPKQQDAQLNEQFRLACDKIFEMNYLMRVVRRKNFFFDKKSREEQLSMKIRAMSDLIRKDREDLETYEGSAEGMNMMDKSQIIDKAVLYKLDVQKRKIGVKQMLLDQFKAELASLRK